MNPADLTLLLAVGAGVVSFLSPCVLPLVPAYLGQLAVVAVAGRSAGNPSRWLAIRHAIAYVLGFAAVFTLLGVTATFVGGPLFDALPALRTIGGLFLVVLGLNLAGILRIPALGRAWRPLEAGAAGSFATASGAVALGTSGETDPGRPGLGERMGGRVVAGRRGWLASFGLGVVFAVGWTPCIGTILGAIITLASSSGTAFQGGLFLFAYSLGLGLPFIVLAVLIDRAPGIVRPLVRHGAVVSLVGGLMVVAIGLALVLDWLSVLARLVPFTV